ncbi:tRNA dimethylallyltransferase [Streptomyces sp. L7]
MTVTASVAEYQRLAREHIDALLAAGRWPILVGGSGLHVRGAVDNLEFPGTDARGQGPPGGGARTARLRRPARPPGRRRPRGRARDPAQQASRRIVRALEVIEITGKPFTANLPGHDSVYDTVQIGVDVARPELDERIARRVDRMWSAGLVDEGCGSWRRRGLREGVTASRALGYQQVLAALAGECTEEERARGDRAGHQALRAPPGFVVQTRSPGALVEWGCGRSHQELPHLALALVERPVTA